MKYGLLIILLCGLIPGACYAIDDDFRDFTSTDGKTVRAKVLRYDKESDTALIESEDHKRYTISPDRFCDADRRLIRNWDRAGAFMSNACLKVSIKHVEERITLKRDVSLDDIDPEDIKTTDYMGMDYYTITLDNLTAHTLDPIKVEIIPFITHDVLNPYNDLDFAIKLQRPMQQFDIPAIAANNSEEISTRQLKCESLIIEVDSSLFSKDIIEIRGVWVRMTMNLPDGTEVVRELKQPDSLWRDIKWSDATRSIDLNTYQLIAGSAPGSGH